jgi:hypothetical protein
MDHEKLVFDAFEVSPQASNVLSAQGSLVRRFPGQSVALPADIIDDVRFSSWLASELCRLSAEVVSERIPTTTKAKVQVSRSGTPPIRA